MFALGRFDDSGSPVIDIQITGDSGHKKYPATIDTGFTGFVALPYFEIVELGLAVRGAAHVQLGDGSIVTSDLASAKVTFGNLEATGTVVLDDGSAEVLVGMAFLREFKLALILTSSAVVLYDAHEALDEIMRMISEVPKG